MSKNHRSKEEWVGVTINGIVVLDKIGERDRMCRNSYGEYHYKNDILKVECPVCKVSYDVVASSFLNNGTKSCRSCAQRNDCLGKQSGKLTVVGYYTSYQTSKNGKYRPHLIYECLCECGEKYETRSSTFMERQAGCCRSCQKSGPRKVSVLCKYMTMKKYLKTIMANAKKRKKEVLIDCETIQKLMDAQDNKCALSGMPISITDGTASLDRIDSSKGYIDGNIQWILRKINFMKSDFTQDEFIEICKKITDYQN